MTDQKNRRCKKKADPCCKSATENQPKIWFNLLRCIELITQASAIQGANNRRGVFPPGSPSVHRQTL